MATGAPDSNGIWIYGEDDSEATFSALLNKLGTSASSALTTKLNALPGKIAQVVYASYGTNTSTTSGTYVTTGLTASITPTSSTSKIIVMYSIANVRRSGATNGTVRVALHKDGTAVQASSVDGAYDPSTSDIIVTSVSGSYVETAGSTSSRTYNPRFATNSVGTATVQTNGAVSSMIILEVTQ